MKKLGLLLACHHYPAVTRHAARIDGQLNRWLQHLGHSVGEIEAFQCHDGQLPDSVGDADIWLVSGTFLEPCPLGRDLNGRLQHFLQGAVAMGQPVFALYHGEHILHDAVAGLDARPPQSPAMPRSIRNPIDSFHCRDRLYAFDPTRRRVTALDRPDELKLGTMLQAFRRVA